MSPTRDAESGRRTCGPRASHDVEVAFLVTAPVALTVARISTIGDLGRITGGCWMHILAGVPCPTCGATRAVLALAHGDVRGALAVQPLVTAIVLLAALYLPWAVGVVTRGWRPLRIELRGSARRPWRWALAGLVLANWAYLIHVGV